MLSIWVRQKRLKEISNRFYINIKYLQFFIVIFFTLITCLLVNLIKKLSVNKKKLIMIKPNCNFDITIYLYITKYLNIIEHIFENIKLNKRNKD